MNFTKIRKYSIFQIKTLLKNKSLYLLVIVPLIFMFTTMTIGTLELFYVGVFSGTFLISTLFIFYFFDTDNEIFRRLNMSKFEKNISATIVALFFNFILLFTIVFYFFFFSISLHILNVDGEGAFFKNWIYHFSLIGVAWGITFYYLLFFTLMAYALYYLLAAIFKNRKTFFLFSVSYIIFTIFFGGVIGSFFDYKVNFASSDILSRNIYIEPVLQDYLNFSFYVSNLFSFFFLNQFVYLMFLNVNFVFSSHANFSVIFNFFEFYSVYWLFLIILPYIWIFFYLSLGVWLNKKAEHNI